MTRNQPRAERLDRLVEKANASLDRAAASLCPGYTRPEFKAYEIRRRRTARLRVAYNLATVRL